MLALAEPTRRSWVDAAIAAPGTILQDHAHCEKKAASTAVGFLFRYPERAALVSAMSRVAREELLHFDRVLGELRRRGGSLQRLTPSPYGAALYQSVRTYQPARLVDELLISALIEARSCERFGLLSEAFRESDPALAALYRELLPSEDRHAALYVELACEVASAAEVADRLVDLAAREAAIVHAREAAGGAAPLRMHSG